MSRLFITEREMNFISDVTKELIKDVNGQFIHYFPISGDASNVHDVYNESVNKMFENPIKIEALVDAQYHEGTHINQFGVDQVYKIEVYVQYRDMIEKGVELSVGDMFSYGDIFYEITNINVMKTIFGQVEHKDGVKIIATKARETQFNARLQGPTDIKYKDDDAVQHKFVQQRGESENSEGLTNDTRTLQESGVLDRPLTGPKEVSEKGAATDNSHYASSFYGDDE